MTTYGTLCLGRAERGLRSTSAFLDGEKVERAVRRGVEETSLAPT